MEKIKHFLESEQGKDILIVLIVILVGIASFELGRLSKENASNGLKIEDSGQEANVIASGVNSSNRTNSRTNPNLGVDLNTNSSGKSFFASKKGKKYYSVDCSAGKTIKETNKIYFSTREEAESAGYELSSACQ